MARLYIRTTQNVDIHYEVASPGDRILAYLLDSVFAVIYIAFMFIIISKASMSGPVSFTTQFLLFLPVLAYDFLCEIFFQGRSPGKMIMKLRVVKIDGSQASVGDYFMRWIFRLIDGLNPISPGMGFLVIMLNNRGQRIGDLAAGTTVIKQRLSGSLNDTVLMQVHPAYTVQFPQVTQLNDRDIRIVREALHQALINNNHFALGKLSARVREVMGVNPPIPDLQFLHIVLADYSRYAFGK